MRTLTLFSILYTHRIHLKQFYQQSLNPINYIRKQKRSNNKKDGQYTTTV